MITNAQLAKLQDKMHKQYEACTATRRELEMVTLSSMQIDPTAKKQLITDLTNKLKRQEAAAGATQALIMLHTQPKQPQTNAEGDLIFKGASAELTYSDTEVSFDKEKPHATPQREPRSKR